SSRSTVERERSSAARACSPSLTGRPSWATATTSATCSGPPSRTSGGATDGAAKEATGASTPSIFAQRASNNARQAASRPHMAPSTTDHEPDQPLLIDEAATILRSGDPTLLGWCESGAIPCARVETRGRQYLVPLGVVAQLLPRLLVA